MEIVIMGYSGRLQEELLERVTEFGARILKLTDEMEKAKKHRRIIDQLVGSGTSSGAQLFEASEAMSRADFRKCLAWSAKELNETRYWLSLIVKSGWYSDKRIDPLANEALELLKIVKTILARTHQKAR